MLSEAQIQRFSRHILLREVGGRGQQRLMDGHVRIDSLDEAGRAAAMWLARAGVGRLALPDDRSPSPALDPAGLLLAEDAGRPLSAAVRERLPFHAPTFEIDPGSAADPAARANGWELNLADAQTSESGIRAALDLVRRIVGD